LLGTGLQFCESWPCSQGHVCLLGRFKRRFHGGSNLLFPGSCRTYGTQVCSTMTVAQTVYQLNREARVVAAICEALSAAIGDYARIIKLLAATMRLADAMNAPGEVAYATFLSAISVLEFDRSELDRLMDDYSDDSLLEAAMMTESHVEDMRSLLEEQADMFARFHGEPQFLEYDQRAHYMIASLGAAFG
jgi:hypothetical protein